MNSSIHGKGWFARDHGNAEFSVMAFFVQFSYYMPFSYANFVGTPTYRIEIGALILSYSQYKLSNLTVQVMIDQFSR